MWDESPSAPSPKQNGKFDIKKFILPAVAVLIVLLGLVSVYFFIQYQNAQKLLKNPNSAQQQVQGIIDKVGKLIDLPKGEIPQVVTVTDKYKLLSQPFFANAENGDQVLVYTKNKEAILYRPSTNKIINFATNVTIGAQTSPTPGVPNLSPTVAASPTEIPTPTTKPRPTLFPTVQPTLQATVAPTATP